MSCINDCDLFGLPIDLRKVQPDRDWFRRRFSYMRAPSSLMPFKPPGQGLELVLLESDLFNRFVILVSSCGAGHERHLGSRDADRGRNGNNQKAQTAPDHVGSIGRTSALRKIALCGQAGIWPTAEIGGSSACGR